MSKSCMSCTFRTVKLCYNGTYRNERRLLSMNSPFWSLVMRYFLEFFSMVPCAVLCFLPVQDRLRIKPLNIFHRYPALDPLAFAGGLRLRRLRDCERLPGSCRPLSCLRYSSIGSVISPLWKPFSILIAVCAVFSCITNLTLVADAPH